MSSPLQLFPALDPATEAALRSSIQRFGVLVPIVVDQEGRIVDGHHRRRIAEDLGVEVPARAVVVADEEEAREMATTLNTDRRHLSLEQRREVVAALRSEGHSTRAIAKAVGVDPKTVRNDLGRTGDPSPVPDRVTGLDGKSRPATRPTAEEVADRLDGSTDPEGEAQAILGTAEDVDEGIEESNESRRLPTPRKSDPPQKPDLGGGVSHPARYSRELIPVLAAAVPADRFPLVLDLFAGTGRIHELENTTVGVELEPEWAALHPDTIVGNALALDFPDGHFDAVVTSPTYGNRLADSHDASDPERRRSYTHDLGRKLNDDNSGSLQWGDEYREFHRQAWREARRVIRPGGRLVLNVKDHVRAGVVQQVSAWHLNSLIVETELDLVEVHVVGTPSLRGVANAAARVDHEYVFVLEAM